NEASLLHLHFIAKLSIILYLVKAYTPIPRYSHCATLIGNKLYILGGNANNTSFVFAPTKDRFFFLDASAAFNMTNIPWADLSNIVGTPIQSGATVSAGGPNKDIIFLVGGSFENSSYDIPLVYTFDTVKNVWNTPIIKGTQPTRRNYIYSIIDVTGKMYLFGGSYDVITVGTIPDARAHRSSVLGYYSSTSPAVAHDLSVLDIRNKPYRWFTPNISGTIPPTPSAHTANVVGRYMIVTYGFIFSQRYINPDMYILDIGDDSEYKW
ncbi:6930_t:CDS:2, partial [Gigaspora rosea]